MLLALMCHMPVLQLCACVSQVVMRCPNAAKLDLVLCQAGNVYLHVGAEVLQALSQIV